MLTYGDQIKSLEEALKDETLRLKTLKQLVDQDTKNKETIKKNILKNTREAKSFRGSLKNFTHEELQKQLDELTMLKEMVSSKREQLVGLCKCLEEFEDLEPTNEALRDRIDYLKNSRLSLEMSFLDS